MDLNKFMILIMVIKLIGRVNRNFLVNYKHNNHKNNKKLKNKKKNQKKLNKISQKKNNQFASMIMNKKFIKQKIIMEITNQ